MNLTRQLALALIISFISPSVAPMAQDAQALSITPQKDMQITVAVASAPRTLNPAIASDAAGSRILQLTHPALLSWNERYQPQGVIAQSCHQSAPATVTCTLKSNLTYTDGSILNAHTVAEWLNQVQTNALSPLASQLKGVKIQSTNATTLQFQLASPSLSFIGTLTEIPIANPNNINSGFGPYTITKHDSLGTVILSTSRTDIPTHLTFTPLSDATTRLLKLKKGEVDAVLNDIPPQLINWAMQQKFNVVSVAGTSYSYLGLNHNNPLLSRSEVREAISMSLNRPAIRKHLLGGLAEPATTLLPPTHPAAWPAPEEPFDTSVAESILDDAGLMRGPNNIRAEITLLISTDPFTQRVAQAIQAQLANVGIAVQLRPTEWASFYDSVKKGNFDMVMMSWTGEQQPPFYYHAFHGSQTPPLGLNRGNINDVQVNELTQKIINAPNLTAQHDATIEVQKRLADVRPYIPLYRRHQILVTGPNLSQCQLHGNGFYTGLLNCVKSK